MVIIKNNDFTQTDFTSMFEDAILNDMDLTLFFNKMRNATNVSSMFKNTDLTSDILIPSNIINCSSMFENCTSMTHIHSNWNNEYNDTIVATNCYKGCTSINNIDGEDLTLNSYTTGLDNVPPEWGGYGFLKKYTGIYKIEIPSDNFTFSFYYGGGDPSYHCLDDGLTSWGDGKTDYLTISHTYEKAGVYYLRTKMLLGQYGTVTSPDVKSYLTEVIQFPTNAANISFDGCTKVTSINVSGCVKAVRLPNTFRNGKALTTIIGVKDIFNSNIKSTYACFHGCTSLTTLDLSNIDVSNVADMSYMFANCSSLTSLNLNGWNVSNVTNMTYMFNEDHYLSELNLSTWVDNGTRAKSLDNFFSCNNGSTTNVGSFITVTLPSIKVNNAIAIFAFNKHIKNADFTNLNFSECESMWKICIGCLYLETATFNVEGNYDNITDIREAFLNCSKLISTNLREVI